MAEVLDGMLRSPLFVPYLRRAHVLAPILGDTTYTGTHPTEPDPVIESAARIPDNLMFLHASELTFFVSSAMLFTQAAVN